MTYSIATLTGMFAVSLCLCASSLPAADPLPSWQDTPLKASLLDFVGRVTSEGSPDFVTMEKRIAVFDNDGTLCAEQPMYFQFAFGAQRTKEQAASHPDWQTKQPFKAALENDIVTLGETEVEGLTRIVAGTHAGRTTVELQESVRSWLTSARHPTLHRRYTELVYQPMLELLRYLKGSGFKIYIVTGSAVEFLRAWSEEVYGIPNEQIIGSNVKTAFRSEGRTGDVEIVDEVAFINNRANKVLAIERAIGRRPILAFGNSDGDLDMLRFAASDSGLHWTGLVHHTDGEREFAYDGESRFGRLKEGLTKAKENGWWIVDMKSDWKTIFP